MKYTVNGFSQQTAVAMGLDGDDLYILRWLVDFYPKMMKVEIDGAQYVWVDYKALLEDMPILNIKKDTLYRRLQRLVDAGVLRHTTVKNGGSYSYYGFNKQYPKLVGTEKNPHGTDLNPEGGTEKNPEQIDPSTISTYPSTKSINTLFSEFWEKYPKKTAKQDAVKAWNKLKPGDALFGQIMKALDTAKHTEDWTKSNGQFVPYPATWLNGKRWEDELTTTTQPQQSSAVDGYRRLGT